MYIWILLATIMIALSFFNLSPRADKDHALNEIKAATVVNRFQAEHRAMLESMKCEIVLKQNTNSWDTASSGSSVDITKDKVNGFDYVKYEDYLPVGYKDSSDLKVKHAVFCLSEAANKTDTTYKKCNNSNYVYIVSYAKVPEKWLTQNYDEGVFPLPVLASYLGKANKVGAVYGWTDCDVEGCYLYGVNSASWDKDGNVQITMLPKDHLFWQNEEFKKDCTVTPCLFAYDKVLTTVKRNECQSRYCAKKSINGEVCAKYCERFPDRCG